MHTVATNPCVSGTYCDGSNCLLTYYSSSRQCYTNQDACDYPNLFCSGSHAECRVYVIVTVIVSCTRHRWKVVSDADEYSRNEDEVRRLQSSVWQRQNRLAISGHSQQRCGSVFVNGPNRNRQPPSCEGIERTKRLFAFYPSRSIILATKLHSKHVLIVLFCNSSFFQSSSKSVV